MSSMKLETVRRKIAEIEAELMALGKGRDRSTKAGRVRDNRKMTLYRRRKNMRAKIPLLEFLEKSKKKKDGLDLTSR